jgi:hypothetical protein
MIELSDSERMCEFLINDPNSELYVLKGSWILELFARRQIDVKLLKRQAQRLSQAERNFEKEVEKRGRKNIHYFSIEDLATEPERSLSAIQNALRPQIDLYHEANLRFLDLSGLREFVMSLDAMGIDVKSLGNLPFLLPGDQSEQVFSDRAAVG